MEGFVPEYSITKQLINMGMHPEDLSQALLNLRYRGGEELMAELAKYSVEPAMNPQVAKSVEDASVDSGFLPKGGPGSTRWGGGGGGKSSDVSTHRGEDQKMDRNGKVSNLTENDHKFQEGRLQAINAASGATSGKEYVSQFQAAHPDQKVGQDANILGRTADDAHEKVKGDLAAAGFTAGKTEYGGSSRYGGETTTTYSHPDGSKVDITHGSGHEGVNNQSMFMTVHPSTKK